MLAREALEADHPREALAVGEHDERAHPYTDRPARTHPPQRS
jgi:hypothetical protein